MTHTKAPWSVSGQLIVSAPVPLPNPKSQPRGKAIAELRWDYGGDRGATEYRIGLEEMESNGRLIASAPELLDACKFILFHIENREGLKHRPFVALI